MIKVGVVGATGRTGRHAIEALRGGAEYGLHGAIVSPESSKIGSVVEGTSVSYSGTLQALAGSDLVIEFSVPEASVEVVRWCAGANIPVLVATTGHSDAQLAAIRSYAEQIPIAITPNTSVGAAALSMLAAHAKRILGPSFDIEVMEIHHKMKKDAPSGTARAVISAVEEGSPVVFGREGKREAGEIGVVSLRGGDVSGDHTVYFLGHGERIEISHRVSTREVFGRGAVTMALRLLGRAPGLYAPRDLLG
jgi:4-hydroxy-tetrahydrodipicolinate reductase